MSDSNNPWGGPAVQTVAVDTGVDAGLRRFMLGVYNKLCLGLILAGALAWVVGNVPQVTQMLFQVKASGRLRGYTGIGAIVAFAPLVMLLFVQLLHAPPQRRWRRAFSTG